MKDLIILAGPTAVGKSALAVDIASKINGSVISADSMQVYRGMDIGTAKITKDEMRSVPHYLIDILDPEDDFNIVTFQEKAKEAIKQITASGRIPMIVGGTGFYIQSVLYDIDFSMGDELTQYRAELNALIEEKGAEYVHKILERSDPDAAAAIHYNDKKRMIRALEYIRQTGRPISEHNRESAQKPSPYNYCYFVLTDDREKIYHRIDERVDRMIEDGLVDEVRKLTERGLTRDNVSMHGIGYKEIIDHLDGICSLDEAIYTIKRESRHFAKRQLTWFKREKDVIWLDKSKDTDIMGKIMQSLSKRGIINE
ncbi:MAG: tRNA (adenosine(37)-N6)-dimethylallyltransferase MiaA [Lachnospiraceae bacterium]|nr:tRNA (adenosine(37)-N6)-dimethylallyltransferase MiaA [Lachnospiraceae bacterium]